MNANREAVNGTDSKFADDELDVYNLDEDQLWTSSELEEMRPRKSSQTKKSSTGSDKTKAIEEEPETAPKKKASRVNASGATPVEESRPDFYHGVGPYNDVNLPGVWFFRIPHKVIGDNLPLLTLGPVCTTLQEFENATITAHFAFLFEENSVREIT